jgi:hypothetical protein
LQFEFGFGTDEIEAPGTFFDSFSITLESADGSATALLLTADLLGPLWAPPNPGGLELAPEDLSREEIDFNTAHGSFARAYAFAVSLLIPQAFLGQMTEIFFDLFDNLNELQSTGYFSQLEVELAATVITWAEPEAIVYGTALSELQLNAMADVEGTFAYDPVAGTILGVGDHEMKVTFTPDSAISESAIAAVNLTVTPAMLTVRAEDKSRGYGVDNPELTAAFSGFVNNETLSVLDGAPGLTTAAQSDSPAGDYPIIASPGSLSAANYSFIFVAGTLTVTAAAPPPRATILQSSASPGGPYADEQGFEIDPEARTVRLPLFAGKRFFRLQSSTETRINAFRLDGNDLVIPSRSSWLFTDW